MAPRRKVRQREAQLAFEALSIEGGLISPEWLAKVAQQAAGGQAEADYRVHKGLNLRDEIGRYWRIAQALWADFDRAWKAGAADQPVTAHFVTGLLRECFGFASLASTEPVVKGERTFPIGWVALEGKVPVVIVAPRQGAQEGPRRPALEDPTAELGDGGLKRSAFGLAQEYLNAEDGALWAVVCDGAILRTCRDNASLTRPAWIEADLARIFAEERYSDFAALWLLAHETRFGAPGQPVTACHLETWRSAGKEEGTRARESLRDGVEEALKALGKGFLTHPENQVLREALAGDLKAEAFFQELLRLVYRLIFLLTAEERELLHPADVPEAVKERYRRGYSLRRLRDRSVRRSAHDRFGDLWEGLKITLRGVGAGEPRMGLPALGGLFAASQCPHLDGAKLENRWLMAAVFRLAWLKGDAGLVRVNWRDMGPEELGSVYESLLELVPVIPADFRGFGFATGNEAKGNARKTTGSYYTPDSLVQVLLDSALEPVVKEAIAKNPADPAEAVLSLTVVDPACGSGHFLLAAANRLANHVARFQAKGTPTTLEYRHAIRQVVGRCLFGVDLNPMAVELCRVALWMEAMEPGRPLSFLDSHIQRGNALLGTTPELMAKGIPDAAFDAIEGDEPATARLLKKRNKAAAQGQRSFDLTKAAKEDAEAAEVRAAAKALDEQADADLAGVAAKQGRWAELLESKAYQHQKLVADAWCAAFVWPKPAVEAKKANPLVDAAPTNDLWRQLRDGQGVSPVMVEQVGELTGQYHFLHWHLAFPQVFERGGFDVVLGNPPWEKVKLLEHEFFASRHDGIAGAVSAAARKTLIAALPQTDPTLWDAWLAASRWSDGQSHVIRNSERYPLCGKGDVNTYAIFAEHNRAILGPEGAAGFIVPTGIATDDTTKEFFAAITSSGQLASLYDFENAGGLFPGVHRSFRLSLVTFFSGRPSKTADLLFNAHTVGELSDPERHISMSPDDFAALNPNTRTCPTFRSRRDANINRAMYRGAGVFWCEAEGSNGNPWGLRFLRMFDMTNDSGEFRTRTELEAGGGRLEGSCFVGAPGDHLPLIEGRMNDHFDHRYASVVAEAVRTKQRDASSEFLSDSQKADPESVALPRRWVAKRAVLDRLEDCWRRGWMLGWRDITAATNQRTFVASVVPLAAVGNTIPLMLPVAGPKLVACLYACLCSFALDYAARQKVGGTHLNYLQVKQVPVPAPGAYAAAIGWQPGTQLHDWLLPRVLELTYTAWDLEPFAQDVGYDGPPFRWDPARRILLRAELDAAFFHLYGIARDDVDYIMETFPIVRKNDEKAHGEYRTKRVILEIYDAMNEAIRTGQPYQTRLDPPPADPAVAHPRQQLRRPQ